MSEHFFRHPPPLSGAPHAALLSDWQQQVGATIDPLGVFAPIMHAQLAWLLHPQELIERVNVFWSDVFSLGWHTMFRAAGRHLPDLVKHQPDDTRFSDPIWNEHVGWNALKQSYLLITRHAQDMLYDTPGLSGTERRRAAFWWRQWLNAIAPTNFLFSNPVAQRAATESQGRTLIDGWHNYMDDLQAGDIRMTNPDDFQVGRNLALTPGAVVHRTRLVEIIHYKATAKQVRSVPVVIITPWINKFYILDLTPKKSMVRYLLEQGFDVYITSWKNPGAELRDVRFDDYLMEGIQAAVDTACAVSGSPKVHAVGYCIGGTALTTYLAWADRHVPEAERKVAHWSVFTTLVDFSHPGDVEVFIDEGSVRYITHAMEQKGYLDGKEMAGSFRLLRSNPLVWQYVVQGYLMGQKPSAFDVLYWNMDATRMPSAMHGWYLKEYYLRNRLIEPDGVTVAGEPIDISRIDLPLYAVAAEDDHIAPWRQTFRIMNFVRAEKRFVLSSSGHILGIVNPPVQPPKREYWVATAHRADTPSQWRDRSQRIAGSWWEDWTAWLHVRCGELREPPPLVTKAYPQLAAAPGEYVLER